MDKNCQLKYTHKEKKTAKVYNVKSTKEFQTEIPYRITHQKNMEVKLRKA